MKAGDGGRSQSVVVRGRFANMYIVMAGLVHESSITQTFS
jgi:hypothetical protein